METHVIITITQCFVHGLPMLTDYNLLPAGLCDPLQHHNSLRYGNHCPPHQCLYGLQTWLGGHQGISDVP